MSDIETEAWVIEKGDPRTPGPARLLDTTISFPDITPEEILVEPLYGAWEANMTHALAREPVDICRARGESQVVLGNAGVVRVLKPGAAVRDLHEGDVGVLVPIGQRDDDGFLTKVFGYDAPGTVGLLARRTKLRRHQIVPLNDTRHALQRWASFSVRYANAWSNWEVAVGCWQLQMRLASPRPRHVCAWGGGVSVAEVTLAKSQGWSPLMVASTDYRLAFLKRLGVEPIDRREFPDLIFDPVRFDEPSFRRRYLAAEWAFRRRIEELTDGAGIAIFVDNIGTPVQRATLKVLADQGVVTTCGWKHGTATLIDRATECMHRHIHVHTHGSTYQQGVAAMAHAERTGWLAPEDIEPVTFTEVPELADAYVRGEVESYFPIFEINPE